MTNEELQEKIEFIINQQAHFTADMHLLKEAQVHFTADMHLLKEAQAASDTKIETLADFQANSETRLSRVEESFVLLVQTARIADERLDSLTQSETRLRITVAELAEMQKHTDERLNTFIAVLERYISNGRNGHSQE